MVEERKLSIKTIDNALRLLQLGLTAESISFRLQRHSSPRKPHKEKNMIDKANCLTKFFASPLYQIHNGQIVRKITEGNSHECA